MYFSGEKKLKLTNMVELQKSVPNAQRVKFSLIEKFDEELVEGIAKIYCKSHLSNAPESGFFFKFRNVISPEILKKKKSEITKFFG